MSTWETFTERSKRAVFFAQEEAKRFGTHILGTEHLLLGLIIESEESTAATLLSSLNISPDRIRSELEVAPNSLRRLLGWVLRSKRKIARGDLRLSRPAKRAIDRALSEAHELDDKSIKTAHLLLGLVRETKGLGGKTLRGLGVELGQARDAYIRLIATAEDNEAVAE